MNEAQNLMKILMDQTQSIQCVAQSMVDRFPQFVYELSKIIDKCFDKSNMDKKNTCIELVCQILKKSVEKNCKNQFIKGLAQRLRFFLLDLSKNYVSEGIALNVGRNIDALKFKDIFCDEYFQKLQQLTKKIKQNSNPAIMNQFQNSMNSDPDQKNYTKTFLIEYEDITSNQSIKAIYETFIEYSRLENELNQSKVNMSEMDEINARFDDSFSLGVKSNFEVSFPQSNEIKKQKYEQLIEQCHSHILFLKQSLKNEMKKFEQNVQTVSKFDSQNSITQQ